MSRRPAPTLRRAARVAVLLTAAGLAACPPGSIRPAFRPFPNALTAELPGSIDAVIAEARSRLAADGLVMQWLSAQDGYLETRWFNTVSRQSGALDVYHPEPWVKVRVWADPGPPGKTLVTVEAVYRATLDPSRSEREVEVIAAPGHAGYELIQRLMDGLRERFK